MQTKSAPNSSRPKIHDSWYAVLKHQFDSASFQQLRQFLVQERSHYRIYPPGSKIFAAFDRTPLPDVKAVIIGQDPYHGLNQANGLCFSVSDGIPQPPSLKNIFKELQSDLGLPVPKNGNLEPWADQGVLLLNATLTVRASQAGSHQKKGWEQFTDTAISAISKGRENVVFILWGRFAQQKAALIDASKHHILKAAHPSPFSAHNGFLGCKHFSKTNLFLESKGIAPINWAIEPLS